MISGSESIGKRALCSVSAWEQRSWKVTCTSIQVTFQLLCYLRKINCQWPETTIN